jgi:hypothetical protein
VIFSVDWTLLIRRRSTRSSPPATDQPSAPARPGPGDPHPHQRTMAQTLPVGTPEGTNRSAKSLIPASNALTSAMAPVLRMPSTRSA